MSLPGLKPQALLALRTAVKQNAHYVADNEILYPAGAVLLLHDYPQQQQKYISLMEKSIYLEMVIIAPSRTIAAIILNDEKGQIVIYDLKLLKKKRTLNLPHDANTKRFEHMCFSHDEKLLLTVTGDPDWMMLSYNWEKGKVETFTRANYINNPGPVTQVLCSPTDSAVCCLLGPGLFRLMSMQETVWRQYGFQKADQVNVSTAAFLGGDRVLVGTSDGRLLLVDNGELKSVYDAATVDIITVAEKEEGATTQPVMIPKATPLAPDDLHEDREVRTLIAFNKGFAFSCRVGRVHMFEKEEKNLYRRRNLFVIVDSDFREVQTVPLNTVQHMSIDSTQDKLLATTNRSQIYTVRLWGPTITTTPEIPFKHLGESLHHGPISGLAMCSWKPLFMTSGAEDRTVRLWNFETGALEMVKQYEEDVLSVALHPTSLFAAIGFTDKLRYMIVLLDNIQPCRTFPIPECRLAAFSSNGHYLAAVNRMSIVIYSTISFHVVSTFKGHSGKITSLVWTPDDSKLVSCGTEGAVYEWDVSKGCRVGETVDKGVSYWECAVTADGKFVYAVGNDGQLKEMCDSNVLRAIGLGQKDLPHIVLSRSDQMMFVCGEAGLVLSVKLPLIEPVDRRPFLFHNSRILKIMLTYDDKTLVTVSETGSLCIWNVTEAEGKTIESDKDFSYCTDVLIPKVDLQDKVAKIKELSQRMQEAVMEQDYKSRQAEANHAASIQEVHKTYGQAIEELKKRIQKAEMEHQRETTNLTREIAALREINEVSKQEMEGTFNSRLIVEYEKFTVAQEEKASMAAEYEEKIATLIVTKDAALEIVQNEFLGKISKLESQLQQFKKDNDQEKKEHEEIKRQIEDDADREIIELKASYEKTLRDERELNVKVRGEAGVMRKKLAIALKENDKYKMNIAHLQSEQHKSQGDIQNLHQDISELKREIYERDITIQDKEKRIYDMKKKNEELEKYKFVLGHKIEELKNQLEPKEKEIENLDKQIVEMELEMEGMQIANGNLEVAIVEFKEKLLATDQEVRKFKDKCEGFNNNLKRVGVDILKVAAHIQNVRQLKEGIKNLYDKYAQGEDVVKACKAQSELEAELMNQREHLERTVSTLKAALTRARQRPSDGSKTMKENVMLIEEINELRKTAKIQEDKIARYESLLVSSSGKVTSVRGAQRRLQQALKTQDDVRQEMLHQVTQAQKETSLVQEEVNRLRGTRKS